MKKNNFRLTYLRLSHKLDLIKYKSLMETVVLSEIHYRERGELRASHEQTV